MSIDENEWVLRVTPASVSAGTRPPPHQWLQLKNRGMPPIFTNNWKFALTFASEAEAHATGEKLGLHPETRADAAKGAPVPLLSDDRPPSSIRRANPREPHA
jgi:hypothetical protein